MAQRLLMCEPRYFGVRYAINPWMTRNVGYDAPEALRQWQRLVELLGCAADVEIARVEPIADLPDLTFTANAALVSGTLAVMSSFRHPERRREQGHYRAALARAGFATTNLQQTYFEGAGDALFDRVRPHVYVGFGWRSERGATVQLAELLGSGVVPLLLVDERFYHLDTCLLPLGTGHVVAYMDAFSPQAQRMLRRAVDPDHLIEIGADDALNFACNAVELGDAIVLHDASPKLRARLAAAGYRIFTTDLSEFHRAGGSAKCLTLKLDDGLAVGSAAA